ncbi:hypothetical protein HK100_005141 [Physocladia obscura]|uniref:D-isomer specific 2-hydroxyacid dehydrogenase NAD-binding domain-containing protein n=1 Tax=Physocladia obscura TaxID=109957 RepID=A0AAD5XDF9_9FUNG|nr:hypothetical protein HK100_005141 [Physocladia obscura]
MTQPQLKIAVLDDYQILSEKHFKALPETAYDVTIFSDTLRPYDHPDTLPDEQERLVERLKPFAIISTMRERTPFPDSLISRLPNLRLLLTTGTRNAALSLDAFKQRGISVAGTVYANSAKGPDSTTQHCIALILAAARNIAHDSRVIAEGGWQTTSAVGLTGKTVGIVGLGRLGVAVARILHVAFGMRVVAWSPNLTQQIANEKAVAAGLAVGNDNELQEHPVFEVVSKEELFRSSDIVSVQLVLSDRSRGIISLKDLEIMKPDAIFVNTSRGPLVVEKDLLQVLKSGKIKAAALDVFDLEPLPLDSEWRTVPWGQDGRSHVLLSPHTGYVETDVIDSWYAQQVENIKRWENGQALLHIEADADKEGVEAVAEDEEDDNVEAANADGLREGTSDKTEDRREKDFEDAVVTGEFDFLESFATCI